MQWFYGFLIFSTLLLGGCQTVPLVEVHETYANGSRRCFGHTRNGLKEGTWTCWFPSGVKWTETQFSKGARWGRFAAWRENGQPDVEANYKNGLLHGELIVYEGEGILDMRSHYLNGKLDGIATHYFPDGKVRARGKYKDGLTVGSWEYFDQKGQRHELDPAEQ